MSNMAEWTVIGEAGKALDETERSVTAIGAGAATLSFESLAPDTLTWEVPLEREDATGAILPELGQQVTLRRDGARAFVGNLTGRRLISDGRSPSARLTVSGPWWWLQNIPLSGDAVDQAGNTAERPQFAFAEGSPRSFLIALANRAIELGAPISVGSIASVFTVPRLTLRDMSLAEAISEVMRWVVDGRIYFDYSVGGDPALCMQRRPAASVVTLTPGDDFVPRIDVGPRLDLEIEQVVVQSATRATVDDARVTVWETETAGTLTSGLPRRQIALTSGPEVDTWLPQDFTDSQRVQTKPMMVSAGLNRAVFDDNDERLQAAQASIVGVAVGPTDLFLGFTVLPITGPPLSATLRNGDPIPAGYDHVLYEGAPRDWWTRAGIGALEARATITIYDDYVYNAADPDEAAPKGPAWFQALGGQEYSVFGPGTQVRRYVWTSLSVRFWVVNQDWTDPTTIIRPEDYGFVNPPAGLAANLLSTQNWLPHEGEVAFVHRGEISADNYVGSVLNLAGFQAGTANMRAMIASHSVELDTGLATLRLGAPDRLAYRDLVNRFRVSGNDNITYLVDPVSGDPGDNPEPDPELQAPVTPEDTLMYDSDPVTFSGAYLIGYPTGTLVFAANPLVYDDDPITHNP